MKEKKLKIVNEFGLHARAASILVENASRFSSDIIVIKDGHEVDAKSIMGIMTLAASKGSEIKLRATGDDENEAIEKLTKVVQSGFYENR